MVLRRVLIVVVLVLTGFGLDVVMAQDEEQGAGGRGFGGRKGFRGRQGGKGVKVKWQAVMQKMTPECRQKMQALMQEFQGKMAALRQEFQQKRTALFQECGVKADGPGGDDDLGGPVPTGPVASPTPDASQAPVAPASPEASPTEQPK
ncbi:MAG: periplasmic heavy metal sensor [Candidatus Riflebacteria bacterium]|nr:periplasmic heavy metal sensor [Candidatus Riflebacteria bacterium]